MTAGRPRGRASYGACQTCKKRTHIRADDSIGAHNYVTTTGRRTSQPCAGVGKLPLPDSIEHPTEGP